MTQWLSNHAGFSAFLIVVVIPGGLGLLINYAMSRSARRDDDDTRDEHAKYPGI